MNYKRIYDRIVARAKERVLECYTECHHIVPRCLNGTDEPDNLVDLTPEEHYVCHQLLVKIYPDESKLALAFGLMSGRVRRRNKVYGWLKRRMSIAARERQIGRKYSAETRLKHSLLAKQRKHSAETRQKMSKALKGRKLSEEHVLKLKGKKVSLETRLKLSLLNKGKKLSTETKLKMSNSRKGKGKKHSTETKLKMSNSRKGRVFSDDHKLKLSVAAKLREEKKRATS